MCLFPWSFCDCISLKTQIFAYFCVLVYHDFVSYCVKCFLIQIFCHFCLFLSELIIFLSCMSSFIFFIESLSDMWFAVGIFIALIFIIILTLNFVLSTFLLFSISPLHFVFLFLMINFWNISIIFRIQLCFSYWLYSYTFLHYF